MIMIMMIYGLFFIHRVLVITSIIWDDLTDKYQCQSVMSDSADKIGIRVINWYWHYG